MAGWGTLPLSYLLLPRAAQGLSLGIIIPASSSPTSLSLLTGEASAALRAAEVAAYRRLVLSLPIVAGL